MPAAACLAEQPCPGPATPSHAQPRPAQAQPHSQPAAALYTPQRSCTSRALLCRPSVKRHPFLRAAAPSAAAFTRQPAAQPGAALQTRQPGISCLPATPPGAPVYYATIFEPRPASFHASRQPVCILPSVSASCLLLPRLRPCIRPCIHLRARSLGPHPSHLPACHARYPII
jgi:hypothetical protein